MATETLRLGEDNGIEVEVELVSGDTWEGIGVAAADPWNRGQAYELYDGVAWRQREGATWDCPSGGQYVVTRNGDDEEWAEVE